MKKIVTVMCAFLALTFIIFAQEAGADAGKKESVIPVRIGGYGSFQPAFGSLKDFVKFNAGGGAAVEVGLPYTGMMGIGVSGHAEFNTNPVKVDSLLSVWNMQYYVGGYLSIPFGVTGISFHPEFDYGVVCYFPKKSPDYDGALKSTYVDQLLKVDLGFRYSNPKFAGKLEFELAPTFSFTPEKKGSGVFIGGRLGILYRIAGPSGISEEALAAAAASKEAKNAEEEAAKAEKQAAAAELKAAKNKDIEE